MKRQQISRFLAKYHVFPRFLIKYHVFSCNVLLGVPQFKKVHHTQTRPARTHCTAKYHVFSCKVLLGVPQFKTVHHTQTRPARTHCTYISAVLLPAMCTANPAAGLGLHPGCCWRQKLWVVAWLRHSGSGPVLCFVPDERFKYTSSDTT